MQEVTKKTLVLMVGVIVFSLVCGFMLDQRSQIDALQEQLDAATSDRNSLHKDWLELNREYDQLEKACPQQ
jgi:hypothetical protein